MSSNSESVLAWLRSALHEQMVERVQNFARLTRKRFESALRLAGVLEVQERGTHQYAQALPCRLVRRLLPWHAAVA